MMVANHFDLWQKDAFFSAAEEVQGSADRYLEEFDKAVRLSYRHLGDDNTTTRHRQFISAIESQISHVEAALRESFIEEGGKPFRWVNLDEEEQDDFAAFLSGTSQTMWSAKDECMELTPSLRSSLQEKQINKKEKIFNVNTACNEDIFSDEKASKDVIAINKDVKYVIEIKADAVSRTCDDVVSQADRATNIRNTWSSPNFGEFKIVIADEDEQRNKLMDTVEGDPNRKGYKPGFWKHKCEEYPQAMRALHIALSAFRQTRRALASNKNSQPSGDDAYAAESIGDDPLAASSGQVIVGVESRYRVVYRLVNGIYVLGVTVADHDNSVNVFECINIVNQAVSVIVTACRGVDVTPEKLSKKYAEIYMALDIVLRGVSNIRLAAMLTTMHGESIAKMVHSAIDSENKIRGADTWAGVEVHSVEQQASIDAFSNARFELPPETLAAGEEVAAGLAPVAQAVGEQQDELPTKPEESSAENDPFAASDAINKPQELMGGFKKTKDPSATDLTTALAGLEVTTLPPPEATQSTHINVEGFEGDYGGVEFSNEQTTIGEAFESFSDAWGGGLDPSEFVGTKKAPKPQGLGGLELLQTGPDVAAKAPAAEGGAGTLENLLVKKTEMKGPEMYISEEVSAEFRESLLARVGLMGVVYLRTLPPKTSGDKETEFSFRVEGTSAVKRFVIQSSRVSTLGNGMFHVRTAASDEPLPIIKYSLLPRLTPLPLRVRLLKRHTGSLISVMIQYTSNPDLLAPLNDVSFILKLPVDPTLLKVSPKAVLNRAEREVKWHVQEIPLKGTPGRLRARVPVDSVEEDEDIEVVAYVKFSVQGTQSLSGVCLRPASEGKTDFYEVNHRFESGVYTCN
ncbi:muniscin carboxy-terminal mu-like domain protein [Senna tora]|uniref:Muniscin carboxy-terminal mu-like domain protein n=1 Tax=Senna tora TaxID=362788 RepID=A0A834X5D4_9FABA|nr:muniscin carboxy-terminal mu-like domain protein [Senna tora]